MNGTNSDLTPMSPEEIQHVMDSVEDPTALTDAEVVALVLTSEDRWSFSEDEWTQHSAYVAEQYESAKIERRRVSKVVDRRRQGGRTEHVLEFIKGEPKLPNGFAWARWSDLPHYRKKRWTMSVKAAKERHEKRYRRRLSKAETAAMPRWQLWNMISDTQWQEMSRAEQMAEHRKAIEEQYRRLAQSVTYVATPEETRGEEIRRRVSQEQKANNLTNPEAAILRATYWNEGNPERDTVMAELRNWLEKYPQPHLTYGFADRAEGLGRKWFLQQHPAPTEAAT